MSTENLWLGIGGGVIIIFLALCISRKLNKDVLVNFYAYILIGISVFLLATALLQGVGSVTEIRISLFYPMAIGLGVGLFLLGKDQDRRKV